MSSAHFLDRLPVEIFLGIYRYLDIQDIVRIRRVSRYLNEISCYRDVWADAYRKADFVSPPGPFPSHSARDLEDMLVPSFRADQMLRHCRGEAHKLIGIQYTGVALCVSLVFGRLVLIALSGEIRCYDLNQVGSFDSNAGGSIIYKSTGGTLTSFYCVSAIDAEGCPFACVVLKEEGKAKKQTQISIYKLLDATEVTLDLIHHFECDIFNVHSVNLGSRIIVVQGNICPPPVDARRIVALDVHTRTQLLLPLTDEMWAIGETPEDTSLFISCIPTSTHLILARSLYVSTAGWNTIFNSYALPSSTTHAGSTTLRLSHRGVVPATLSDHLVLLHDAICDPSTRDILVMIRLCTFDSCCDIPTLKHGTLRLGRSYPDEVGTLTFQALGPLGQYPRDLFDRPSFGGNGRVFHVAPLWMRGTIISAFEYDVRVGTKGKPGGKVIEYPSILRLPTSLRLLDFDPYCGRICLQSSTESSNTIEIWDLLRPSTRGFGCDDAEGVVTNP